MLLDGGGLVYLTRILSGCNLSHTEGMVFPTLQFPSDHGLVATTLREA